MNHIYNIKVILYRDCINSNTPFDQSISLFIFAGGAAQNAAPLQTVNIPIPTNIPQIVPNDLGDCVVGNPSICVEVGVYETTVTLPPRADGYDLGWAKCCRSVTINNIATPIAYGITFAAHIPDPGDALCNNMPTFNQFPPVFLCANQPFSFDHSATDIDGDSLVYSLVHPYTGVNQIGRGAGNPGRGGPPPTVDPVGNPMGPPPYTRLPFLPGFSFDDPFGSGDFVIDPQSGFLTVTPAMVGVFVYAISVFEYRDGVLLSENRRDFQINIITCLPQGAPPFISHSTTGLPTSTNGDTIYAQADVPFCYDVTLEDTIPGDVLSAYTVSAAFGNGNFFPPAATFNFSGVNPINGQVCWTPSCQYDGDTIPLIVGGFDIGDCENVGDVFDTVWVIVNKPPNQLPSIVPDLTGLQVNNDTIIISAGSNLCYDLNITDPNPNDILHAFPLSSIFNAPNGPTFNIVSQNPMLAQVCWTPGCDFEDQIFEFRTAASDVSLCNNTQPVENLLFVKVVIPPNDPPDIAFDLSANVFSNDTIFVSALDNLCFDITASDPNLADIITLSTLSPIFNDPNPPTLTTTGNNPLQGQVCWMPSCDYENQVIPFIFKVNDPGVCSSIGEAFDTVYVSVAVPPNDPPNIVADLSGNSFSNDTIFVNANDAFCYDYVASDLNVGDNLNAFTVSSIFNDPNGPSFSLNGNNPVSGQICWTPSCDFVNQTIELIIGVGDDAPCTSTAQAFDTVYIEIAFPPNDPPETFANLANLTTDGDTIFVDPQESFCFNLNFTDPNIADTLTAFAISPIFSQPDGPSFTFQGVNPASAQVCWIPSCDYEGQLIELVFRVEDNGDCDNELEDFDTVFVKINDPNTIAPNLGHDISGNLNTGGDTIYIEIGGNLCYDFYVADNTPENGVDFVHALELASLAGSNLSLTNLDYVRRNDSIIGSVCLSSSCSNGGSLFRSIIRGIDQETCPPFASNSDTVFIKVNTDFRSFAGNDISFCEGSGGVQLNVTPIGGTAPYFFEWGCDDPNGACGLSSPAVSNPIVNPTDTTTYFVQVTDRNGCTSEIDGVQVNVKKLPIVDAGPDQFLCEDGIGTNLEVNVLNPIAAPGPYTYTWTPGATLNDPTLVNPRANPTQTTIYTVVVSSANGCTSDNTTLDTLSTITVHVNDKPVASTGPTVDICFGDTTMLRGFASQGGPDYQFVWTPSTGLDDSTSQTPMASPPQTTTYSLVAWSNGCQSDAEQLTVVVHTLPTSDPGLVAEICGGDSVQLNGIASSEPGATHTYQWTPAIGLDDATSAMPMASPSITTTYTLVATSNFGCESPEYNIDVNVLPAPQAFAGVDSFLCRGDSLALQGSHTMIGGPATGPVFYNWDPSPTLNVPTIPGPNAGPTATTVYTLTVSTGSCSTTDEVKIDVFDEVIAVASADTSRICEGDSVQLFVSGGTPASTYSWTPGTSIGNPGEANPQVAPDQTTIYYVTVTQGTCSGMDSVQIDVNPAPGADFFASQDSGCNDLTIAFLENSANGSNYIWDFGDGSPISNEPNPEHTYTSPGVYTASFQAFGMGGCISDIQTKEITVFPAGVADFTSSPDLGAELPLPNVEIQFTNQSTDAVSFLWDFGDGNFSTEENPLHVYNEAGEYTVSLTITDTGGCTNIIQYGPYKIFIPGLLIPNVFSPNGDGINDNFRITYDGREVFTIKVYDRWGRLMFEDENSPINGWNGKASNGQDASDGVYYYSINIGSKTFTGNVTLMR
ncbi:MAG: PKD domain-containing protein [Bacteroidia bacterium]|nr:PKD domain-containing protein [Bacteroidia bacterium]